jgi:hypothetical protein
MKSKILITAMLFASLAEAKEPKVHQNGTLLQMRFGRVRGGRKQWQERDGRTRWHRLST